MAVAGHRLSVDTSSSAVGLDSRRKFTGVRSRAAATMSPMPFERELDTARRAAARAGEEILRLRAAGVETEQKPDHSPVTAADRASEKVIAACLEEAFPADGVLGEEGARKESASGRRWIIDPIDGTRAFVRGSPAWSVLIALEDPAGVAVGVCYLPVFGSLFFAERGGGAWRDSSRIRASAIESVSRAVLCVNELEKARELPFADRLLGWMSRFWAVRSMGGCLDAMMIAQGQADVWIEPSGKVWDFAPLKIIIEEAGGIFLNFDGGSSIYAGNCGACAPGLEGELRSFLGVPPR